MTAILTTAQYIERYSLSEWERLTDRDGSNSQDPDFFDRWAREATAIIEEYLGAQADPLPEALVGIAAAITRWHLHLYDKPDAVQAGYESAMTRLKAMRDGALSLPSEVVITTLVEATGPTKVFTDELLRGFS